MGSAIDERGSDADVKVKISEDRGAFLQLDNIWDSKQLSTNIKFTIFNKNFKTVLLCGAEVCRTTTTTIKRVQVFINKCLLVGYNQQQPIVEENKSTSRRKLGKGVGSG